ncbi:MAG TPA: copper homeostasis protein CutC [Candidatus Fimousia stercorigallinarum]|nr:copper homeostasis protein CutC [Candidatus Fimousia stercorigallinarum]
MVSFEICCGSAEDAIAAWKGGAVRVELNSDLFHGGLTPSIGTLTVVKKAVPNLKVICMVRPREGGFHYSDLEFQVMLEDAAQLLEHGADGIAFGFLHEDGTIDIKRCQKMLQVIGEKESVFHRAIDVVPDVFDAVSLLSELGVTRILTSGQKPTALEGAETIRQMIRIADGRIEILPGSGIRPHNAARCRELFQTPFLHASMHTIICDNSLAHHSEIHFHGNTLLPETQYKIILPENVADLINQANKN